MMRFACDVRRGKVLKHQDLAGFLFVISAIFTVLSVSGCTSVDVSKTRNLAVTDKPYQRALYLQYAELTLREVEEGNVSSARNFDSKARLAASGGQVPLPVHDETILYGERADVLQAAQRALIGYLDQKSYLVLPVVTARAQAMLDCWIEEEEQGVDIGDVAACQQAFKLAMAVLDKQFPVK